MDKHINSGDYTKTLIGIIDSLGGPRYAAEDLAWASSMPQGKRILEWLSAQIHAGLNASQLDEELVYQAAIQPIALHEQELVEINTVARLDSFASSKFAEPAGGLGPHTLRASSRLYEEEAELLEEETRLTKHRLSRSKVAAKELAQTIKTLQAEIEAVGRDAHAQDAKIGELAIEVDNTTARSARTAENLLHVSEAEESRNTSARSTLTILLEMHDRIASDATEQLASVDEAMTSLPTADEVRQEATRLHHLLEATRSKGNHATVVPGPTEVSIDAYSAQLDEISTLLEATADEKTKQDIIDRLLQDEVSIDRMNRAEVCVEEEVTRAWSMDQQAILHAREKIVDQTTNTVAEELVPSLSGLHTELTSRTAHALEQEALVSTLIEELEGIADDVAAVNARPRPGARAEADGDAPKKRAHEMLEGELTELLKRTQGLRPRDAGPLVLLEREDVAKELTAVRERAESAGRAEEEWVSSLASTLAKLSGEHAELISLVYENAPVNTSPPFGPSAEERALHQSVKQATEHLNAEVQRLEKETQLNERDKRKLTTFVEKWAR